MRWLAVLAIVMAAMLPTMAPAAAFADVAGPRDAAATIVVEIGGVGTDFTPGGPWTRIEQYLGDGIGVRRYQYAACEDINTNVKGLASYVEGLRPGRVVLAGHSLGGVVALGAIDNLTDLVQGVVLVDAPVNGLSDRLVRFGESIGIVPSCPALHQLQDPAWASFSSGVAERALANGIRLLNVNNAYDNMVPLAAQQLPQQVNVRFDVTSGTGLFNHTAVFGSSAALTTMAQFIGGQ